MPAVLTDSGFLIQDYYMSGILQGTGLSSDRDSTIWNGTVAWYDEKGTKIRQAVFKSGLLNGRAVQLRNGKTDWYADYINGELNGKRIRYYPNGAKYEEATYVNDKGQGKAYQWFEDGRVAAENTWKDGVLNGLWAEWYKDGSIKGRANYVNGKLQGKLEHFYFGGVPYRVQYYSMGQIPAH